MPGQSFPFAVASGEVKAVGPIGFIPQAVGVDNPAPFYVHLVDAGFGAWVRPFTAGVIIPAPARGRTINISTKDVPTGQAPSPATSLYASCLAFEDPQSYSSGYSLGGGTRAVAFPSQSLPASTYNYSVPAQNQFRGILVYLAVTGGAGTVLINILNQDPSLTGGVSNIVGQSNSGVGLGAGTGANVEVYPGIVESANRASNVIGETPLIQAVVAGGSATFEVHYDLLP